VENKPKRTPTNFGGWYWLNLLVMAAWSAVCLGHGTTAWRSGHLMYSIVTIGMAALGLACLLAWYPLKDRQPTAQDRLHRHPLLVLGVFDALVLGGGILAQEIQVRLVPGAHEPSTLNLVIGGLCALIGLGYIRSGWTERRLLKAKQAKPDQPAEPEGDDEPAGD